MRYALDVQYRGKNYAGSQIQYEDGKLIDEPTIQGELEKALRTLITGGSDVADNKTRQIKTIFSGRTDKGVNALGQVVHFDIADDTKIDFTEPKILYSLNGLLPKEKR